MADNFLWYELMTTDVAASEAFYKAVIGWNSEPFGGGMPYVVLKAGDRGVAGIMAVPEGSGLSPAWVGYIHSKNVDAATESLKEAGGTVHREPDDIPGVGRFSVVADPQGAMFMLLQPSGEDQPPAPMTPGHIGWHELYASDWPSAFDFYSGQFGWEKVDEMDMGPMGKYLLYKAGGDDMAGGMMTRPDNVPAPVWQFYFIVDDIDAAAERVTGNGGQILMEPMAVPGDAWVLQATDPQGAVFSVTGPRK